MTQTEFNAMLQIAIAQGLPGGTYVSEFSGEEIDERLRNVCISPVESHRMTFRGKNLGTSFNSAQQAAVQAGTFENLFVGDYWEINDVTWRIVDMNYWIGKGTCQIDRPHLLIMPDQGLHYCTMSYREAPTTAGGYAGSLFREQYLDLVKPVVRNAFGSAILTHKEYLTNAVTDGKPSGGAFYDSDIELPNEIMVLGSHIAAPFENTTSSYKQLALFQIAPQFQNSGVTKHVDNPDFKFESPYWMRDVAGPKEFVVLGNSSYVFPMEGKYFSAVRPVFAIG